MYNGGLSITGQAAEEEEEGGNIYLPDGNSNNNP